MTLTTRHFPIESVRAIKAEDDTTPANEFEFVASTQDQVRVFDWNRGVIVRESLRMDGVKLGTYQRNPVVLDSHRKGGSEFVVGRATTRVEGDKLIARVKFTEATARGRENLALVREDMLRALSVGYLVTDSEEVGKHKRSGEPIVNATEWELVEISTTPVPADPNALKRSYDEARMKTTEPKTPEPQADPEPEPKVRTLEDDEHDAEALAAALLPEVSSATVEEKAADMARREKVVTFVLDAEDPAAALAALGERQALIASKTLDPALRLVGGRALVDADNPLEVDVIPALRAALRQRRSVGTPPQPEAKPTKPEPSRSNTTNEPKLTGGDLISLLRETR